MNRRIFLTSTVKVLGTAALATFTLVAQAALSTAGGENTAQFSAAGPGGLSIVGKNSGSVTVGEQSGNVNVTVKLDSLDTGIGLRNKHMKEKYLETGKYPTAVLSVPRASLKFPAVGQAATGEASGTMTLHGKTQPVKFTYGVKNDGGTYRVDGRAALDIRAYDINVPSYLGVTVKPNVDVDVHFSAKD